MKSDRRRFLRTALAAGAALVAAPAVARAGDDEPEPDTSAGKHVLKLDFPGLEIGWATYREGPTGCTVFRFPKGAKASADIRGGAPGTVFTDHLRDAVGYADAICLAGGSLYGLEAASGVARGIFEQRKRRTGWRDIACVPGAIIFDFGVRKTSHYPDHRLGRAALEAAKPGRFALGGHGAGASASCGKWLLHTTKAELAGQGGAFHVHGPTRIAVFTVVNALGAIVDRKGRVVRGHLDPKTKRRVPLPDLRERPPRDRARGNTTLTVMVINQKLPDHALRQVGREVHASMSRAIRPFHTQTDGDVFFTVSTDAVENASLNAYQLAAIGSEVAWDAVLSSFRGR
jgi:L-aminopeptidase/D-esterase-like protein